MTDNSISRRGFLKQTGSVAAAAAAAGAFPSLAHAARENELNILCWEGYNSAQVLDPVPPAPQRDGQGRVADQRPDHDQPPARPARPRSGT